MMTTQQLSAEVDKAWESLEAEPRRRAEQIKNAGPIHGAITPLGFRPSPPEPPQQHPWTISNELAAAMGIRSIR